jgi:hypothetical protein
VFPFFFRILNFDCSAEESEPMSDCKFIVTLLFSLGDIKNNPYPWIVKKRFTVSIAFSLIDCRYRF